MAHTIAPCRKHGVGWCSARTAKLFAQLVVVHAEPHILLAALFDTRYTVASEPRPIAVFHSIDGRSGAKIHQWLELNGLYFF